MTVATDGGRYDVNVTERTRSPVYWPGEVTNVRRCSWFFKAIDSRFMPYEENIADLLEVINKYTIIQACVNLSFIQ